MGASVRRGTVETGGQRSLDKKETKRLMVFALIFDGLFISCSMSCEASFI